MADYRCTKCHLTWAIAEQGEGRACPRPCCTGTLTIMALTPIPDASKPDAPTASKIDDFIEQRKSRYGDYYENARVMQNIKAAMRDSPNWDRLTPAMKESLEMVAHKIGRILGGDPNFHDNWYDIEGYTNLITKTLESKDATT